MWNLFGQKVDFISFFSLFDVSSLFLLFLFFILRLKPLSIVQSALEDNETAVQSSRASSLSPFLLICENIFLAKTDKEIKNKSFHFAVFYVPVLMSE